jgi:hypothetical protein
MSFDDDNPEIVNQAGHVDIELGDDDLCLDELVTLEDPHESDVPLRLEAMGLGSPSDTTYIRTPPEETWMTMKMILDSSTDDRRMYVVPKKLIPHIPDQKLIRSVVLVPFTTLEKSVGIWPLKKPVDPEAATSIWYKTAYRICQKAQTEWTRKQNIGGQYGSSKGEMKQEPWWPDDFGPAMIKELALDAITITSTKHPIIQRLRGLA